MTTVICLDDYHSLDRNGRKRESVTALDPKAQNFDLMYEQIKDLKDGKTVAKPIYNHVTGLLDAPEDTTAPKVRRTHPLVLTFYTSPAAIKLKHVMSCRSLLEMVQSGHACPKYPDAWVFGASVT